MQKRFLQDDNEGVKAGNIARQQLLGEWPVAKEYLALAARLNIGSILQVLNAIEPEVVRGWLQIPRLDWTSVDALASWANQIPLSVDSVSNGHKFVENSILFGYSIFPDTLIVRQRALSLLLDLTHTAQHGAIQQLLSSAEVSASLALKASVVLMVHDWLNGRRANGLNEGEHLTSYKERHDALIIRVLQGWTVEDDYQATITQLEALLCRWLYRAWSIDDSRFREELAYLAFVGAGFVMDTLAVAGQISSSVVRDITHRLLSDIKSGPIHSRSELQLNGFFHPVLGTSLNYAASYLLHGLLSSEAYLPEYHTQPLLKEVALQCGVSHRIQQAFLGSNQLESAWLDSELVTDIGSACTKVLGGLSESDIEKWSELDRYRIIVAASQEAVGVLAQQMTRAIATQETEAEIMGSLTTLFQGKMHPTPIWYETLSILLEPDVLEKIHKFAQSYGEVVANFVLILIQQDANCPSELRDTIGDFLLEVPTSVNTAELIKAKAYVFSQLLHSSLDIALVCKWIQNVAADDQLDGSTVRLAFRPFILMWQDFGAEVRKSLFDTLMEIAVMPKYKGLWEFARLTRVQESFDM
jgi:hypothetical protein